MIQDLRVSRFINHCDRKIGKHDGA